MTIQLLERIVNYEKMRDALTASRTQKRHQFMSLFLCQGHVRMYETPRATKSLVFLEVLMLKTAFTGVAESPGGVILDFRYMSIKILYVQVMN